MNALEIELGYFSKDLALELEITTSTLRRWSIALEKNGYIFERNEKEQRVYYDRDFRALRELKLLLSNSIPFDNAIKVVASMDFENENPQKTPSVYNEMIRLSKSELQLIIQSALEQEREIILAAMDEKLNNKIEQRDRALVHQLKETLTEKQLELQRPQKGFFRRIFSK